jgi:ABC-type polysaccharide/polyol phosphate export permease
MARHGGGHGNGGMDQINLDAPHVGMITALTLVAFAAGLFLMPFRYLGAFLRVLVIAAFFIVPYAWIVSNLGESNLFDHPLLCLPLFIAGMWVSDAMRAKDEARKAKKIAMRKARMSQQKGTRT